VSVNCVSLRRCVKKNRRKRFEQIKSDEVIFRFGFLDCLTLEDLLGRLTRNVGKYQSMLGNISEEPITCATPFAIQNVLNPLLCTILGVEKDNYKPVAFPRDGGKCEAA